MGPQRRLFSGKDHSLDEETDGPAGATRWCEKWTIAGEVPTSRHFHLCVSYTEPRVRLRKCVTKWTDSLHIVSVQRVLLCPEGLV